MESENINERIPSNEEVIDEVTHELNKQHINSETRSAHTSHSTEQFQECCSSDALKDFDKSDSEDENSPKPCDLEDFVDEEELMKLNSELTDEQKEKNKSAASELKKLGNITYKESKYLEAIDTYTQALRLYPLENTTDRSILYSNRAACKMHLERKQTALDDCTKSIDLNPQYVRAYVRRAKLYEETDKLDESLEDYKKILELDPGNKDALKATVRLPPLIQERNEKLKTEMMGKLKDLGNLFLKPFGLSTENFKLQQDPVTGSYSVNFQQNQ